MTMRRATDQLVDAYFSEEANTLKTRSNKALKIAIAAGLAAVLAFASGAVLLFLSVLGLNPLSGFATALAVVFLIGLLLVLVVTGWVFTGRFLYLRAQLSRYINQQMTSSSG